MNPKIPIAAITDEFSPDLETALHAMREIGMSAAELRVIWGKNIMDLSDEELERVQRDHAIAGFQNYFDRLAAIEVLAAKFTAG